jgi:hypothetical protein
MDEHPGFSGPYRREPSEGDAKGVSKAFFSEEKKQKTFPNGLARIFGVI